MILSEAANLEINMIVRKYVFIQATLFVVLMLVSCDFFDEQQDDKTYETRMREAQNLKDKAEKLYLEAMSNEAGTKERNSLLRKAYDVGEKAMDIFNKLDEQFGQRVVPDGEVLAHKPIMEELSELMVLIVRAMSAVD